MPATIKREQRVKELLTRQHPVGWNSQNNFPLSANKPENPVKFSMGSKELRLIIREEQEQPMWELVNHSLKTTSWTPLNPNLLKNYSKRDRLARIQCQDIDPHSIFSSTKIDELFLVQKSMNPSKIDPRIITDNNNWAVSLLDLGTCDGGRLTTWGGHAAISVEGIEDNLPFSQVIDLKPLGNGKAEVQIQEYNCHNSIPYSGKAFTYLITKDKAQKMMEKIRKERDETEICRMPFEVRGLDAIHFTKKPAHNCISWAREKLALCGIEITPGLLALIANFPKQYTT